MEKLPRHYMALAFVPVILAVVTLAGLYLYQQGARDRRDHWQKPGAVLDAIGVESGMRVAESMPSDTYFLERLLKRVGGEGSVFAVAPSRRISKNLAREVPTVQIVAETPSGLDAVLSLHVTTAKQDSKKLQRILIECSQRLNQGGRIGVIGVRNGKFDAFLASSEVEQLGTDAGLELISEEHFVDRQFLVVLEKNSDPSPYPLPRAERD